MRTSYKEKGQEIGTQKKTVTFEEPDKKWVEVKSGNPVQENFFRGEGCSRKWSC